MKSPSLFLEDYLDASDFGGSLRRLTSELGDAAGLPEQVDEVGLVCSNVLRAADYLEKTYAGMKVFFLGSGSPVLFVENGKPSSFTTRVGFGYYKGVILELAEPGIGSNVFSQTQIVDDRIMINHLGFNARGDRLERKERGNVVSYAHVMAQLGIGKRVEAGLKVLGLMGHIHIFETMHLTHAVEIEFLDFRLLSVHGPKIPYPATLVGLIGWYQQTFGPRFLRMKEDQPLPPPSNER